MKKFLSDCGLEVDYYIPNRLDEGYGLNKDAIDKMRKLAQEKYEPAIKYLDAMEKSEEKTCEVFLSLSKNLEIMYINYSLRIDIFS